jgi:hypothetical protein
MRLVFLALGLCACSSMNNATVADGGGPASGQDLASAGDLAAGSWILQVAPAQLTARQHVAPLTFEFEVPAVLHGGGATASTVDIELPLLHGQATADELAGSGGVAQFDPPLFCPLATPSCADSTKDGFWRGEIQQGATITPIQLGFSQGTYPMTIGAFLDATVTLNPGDKLRFVYTGSVPGRTTDWTDRAFLTHCRYRDAGATFTLLDDTQVQPVQFVPDTPAFVRATAPLDVQVGQMFDVAVVVTDKYGNPVSYTGSVMLTDGVTAEVQFTGQFRQTIQASYSTAGFHRIVPMLAGARSVYHYTNATASAPPVVRLFGDVHVHTGDGGAQRKFLGDTYPGDHRALYSRSKDALRYMELVAGHDFGAISEHAVRWGTYALPAPVAADAQFATGGACALNQTPVLIGNWFKTAQQSVGGYTGGLITFPAYEWHSSHGKAVSGDTSPLHRIVLFRDFDPNDALPFLPDMSNGPPTCIVRFLSLVGFGSDKALVVPHMMQAADTNIDWDLTYAGSTTIATRAQVEDYHRVGEIFSSRAYDQGAPVMAGGKALLTIFEGADTSPGKWSYRYGWTAQAAHIGLLGNSDNHEQQPGVNDDVALDGSSFHNNESSGDAVVLAATKDRGGVFDGLRARRSYGTSGSRVWLDYSVDGMPMGSSIANSGAQSTATITIAAGLTIARVELWSARSGDTASGWTLVSSSQPMAETVTTTVPLPNAAATGTTQEYLYYARAFLSTPVAGGSATLDEEAYSSPVWISWTH